MKTIEELFTAAKVAQHEKMEAMPKTRFIRGRNRDFGPWHIGVKKEQRYSRSNLIAGISYVASCNGKQLGGAYGYSQTDELQHGTICPVCMKRNLTT